MTAAGRPPSPPIDAPGLDAPAADDPAAQALVESPVQAAGVSGRASVLKSSAVYSGLTLISRLLGFVRDLVVTAAMGASAGVAADAWNTALAFPNLFRRFFAEGAFAAAFVPAYSKSLAKDGEEHADILAADAMATLAAATIVLTVVAELTMPWLMHLISPGFARDPAKFKLAVLLTQITMPYLPCMAIYAHLSGVLNARGRFVFSALAPALLNIGTLVAVLPQKTAEGAAIAAAWGAVEIGRGAGGHAVVGRAPLRRAGGRAAAAADARDPCADRIGHSRCGGGQRHAAEHLHLGLPGQFGGRRALLAGGGRPTLPAAAGPGGRGHRRRAPAAPQHRRAAGRQGGGAGGHGRGGGDRHGADPARRRRADRHAVLPDRRPVHAGRVPAGGCSRQPRAPCSFTAWARPPSC